jgi:hypothetical protein
VNLSQNGRQKGRNGPLTTMPSEITSDLSISSYAWLSPAATVPGRSGPEAFRTELVGASYPLSVLLAVGDFTGRQRVSSHR